MRMYRCIFWVIAAAILLGGIQADVHAQTNGNGNANGQNKIDIVELAQRAKNSLHTKGKLHIKRELLEVLASDVSMDIKNQAAVRLAEIMIYSPGSLNSPESLLQEAVKLIPDEDYALKAEAEYLLGVIDYIKSQVKTRTIDNEKKRMIQRGIGDEKLDPYLVLATEHFDTALQYPPCEAAQKAKIVLDGMADPYSYEAFLFFASMGKLFDDNSRLNTFAVGKQYYRVIETYEKGVMKQVVENGSLDEQTTAGIITDLSLAYFTSSKFNKALEVNEKGLNRFGKTEKTGVFKFNRASIYKYMSKYDEAEREYSDLMTDFPLTEDQYFIAGLARANVLLDQKKKQKAKEVLQQLTELESENKNKEKAEKLLDKLN